MRHVAVVSMVVMVGIWWAPAPCAAGGVVDVSAGQGVALVAGRDRSAAPPARAVSVAVGFPRGRWLVRLRARHLWFRIAAPVREVEQSASGLTVELERALGGGFALGAGVGAALVGGATLERKTGIGPSVSARPSYALVGQRARLRLFGEASAVALRSGRVIGVVLGLEATWAP